jgi:serine/threonine-protein kinase
MGEVYRADDLKLGQPVALKFLPREVETDPRMLERFHAEVRNARQISHPHVCRVHDIDDVDGRHFITMEYVDGEDLATLLRRIGRLPETKAVEIARQVCAGLQAIHDRSVVHRDLKPGNVMIDGHGRARITDFGLAVSGAQTAGEVAGTPAYMAPEQLAGDPATPQTDLYALGLLLYEICTGKRPFEAKTLGDWKRAHSQELPVSPGRHTKDLDETVERVIMRCLEKDPARRPRSAAQVALALPGGDPLAAAIAAGETPSPEMVAAATHGAALRPGLAITALGAIVLLLGVLSWASQVNLYRRTPFEKPADVLADRAATLIADLGYTGRPEGRAWGFSFEGDYLAWLDDPMPAPARWRRLETGQPLAYSFWYRQSSSPLTPHSFGGNRGEVSLNDPPASIEGMASVLMDTRGRLVEFRAVPPAVEKGPALLAAGAVWTKLFAAAGLDQSRFKQAEPAWTPPVFADQLFAWTGAYADHPDLGIRIEAAAARDRAVYFRVAAPWDQPPVQDPGRLEGTTLAAGLVAVVLTMTIVLGAAFLARRNLSLGRGDSRGAIRIAAICAAAASTAVFLRSDLPMTLGGVVATLVVLANAGLMTGAIIWTSYIALEPYVRRNKPHLIVSWTRFLAGEFRDPIIGRDILVGLLLGLGMTSANYLSGWMKAWTAHPLNPNHFLDVDTLNGISHAIAGVLDASSFGVWVTFAVLVFLILVRKLVRREWAAALLLWAALLSMEVLFAARSWPVVVAAAIIHALTIAVVARLGLVAGLAASMAFRLTAFFPLTSDLSAPYAGASLVGVLTIVAAAVYGFWISRGTEPLIDADSPDA